MKDFTLGTMKPRGTRRLIYNSDPSNTTRHLSEPAAKEEELRQVVRYYVKGSIDTVVQEIWSQSMTSFFRTDKFPYTPKPNHQKLVPMMDEGVMPIEIYIDECHKQKIEFLAGFRMNDRHGHHPDIFEKIYKENPDWILKGYWPSSTRTADARSYKYGCALNYSVEGVRDWIFSIMEEVANRFDIDGMEFNYTRLPACFPKGEAESSHAIMTEFVRRVRTMLDEVGEKKGRRLILGVRVFQHLESCKKIGFDIPTWIKEGLINYVAPADVGFTDFNAKYEEFVKLGREYDCYVYPQFQPWLGTNYMSQVKGAPLFLLPKNYLDQAQSTEHYRAVVQNFYGAGSDGFSTQNYFEVEGYDTLKELRDPETVGAGDHHYAFYPLWGKIPGVPGGYKGEFPYDPERIVLSRQELGERGEFRFRMCENLPKETKTDSGEVISGAMLMFRPSIVPGDEIEIDINGEKIPAENISYEWSEEADELHPADQPPTCHFALSSPPAVYGDNYLGMKLLKSGPDAKGDIDLFEVEVIVKANG